MVASRAVAWVQSALKCAHVPVPTTAHPVRVLVNEAAVRPPSGSPEIRTAVPPAAAGNGDYGAPRLAATSQQSGQ